MKRGQISVEYIILLTVIILVMIPAIIIYQNRITQDKEPDKAMAHNALVTISDQIQKMSLMGPGWQTLSLEIPAGSKEISAIGKGELVMRMSDGTQVVQFMPRGIYAFSQDNGLKVVSDAKNNIKITNRGAYFCLSDFAGDCVNNACIDNDEDGYYLNCGEELDCDDTDYYVNPGQPAEDSASCVPMPGFTTCCDGVDNNCDGKIDGPWDEDQDGWYPQSAFPACQQLVFETPEYKDGVCYNLQPEYHWACYDCAPNNPYQHPLAFASLENCDAVDWDCDGGGHTVWDKNVFPYEHLTVKRTCADLFLQDSPCAGINHDVSCMIDVSGDYVWNPNELSVCLAAAEEEYGSCDDGIDNDCDGYVDMDDFDCKGLLFLLTNDADDFKASIAFGEEIPLQNEHFITSQNGLKSNGVVTNAIKVDAHDAELYYNAEHNIYSEKGTLIFHVAGPQILWQDNNEYALFALVNSGQNQFVKVSKDVDKKIKVQTKGSAGLFQQLTSDDTVEEWQNDVYHAIALTWENDEYHLYVDFKKKLGSKWPAEIDNIYIGNSFESIEAPVGFVFDNITIFAEKLSQDEIFSLMHGRCDYDYIPGMCARYGDLNDMECIDSNDKFLINEALSGDIDWTPCMDMNQDCYYTQEDVDILEASLECPYVTASHTYCVQKDDCIYYADSNFLSKPKFCSDPEAVDMFITGCMHCNPACMGGRTCLANGQCHQSGGASPLFKKEQAGPAGGGI